MDQIEILPRRQSLPYKETVESPEGVEYSMSIRDYQSLATSNLKVNRKGTNRIRGNRIRAPSEKDRDEKRARALDEIFHTIKKQEARKPSSPDTDHTVDKICHYNGRDIPYSKRQKR
jgi:hypothetical protein